MGYSKVLMTIISASFGTMLFASPSFAQQQKVAALVAPEEHAISACAATLKQLTPASPNVKAVRKLFAKNTHFRGARHNPIPHWNADYDDVKNVFASLTPNDIESVVYLLKVDHMNSGMRSIGAGVLKMFGSQSLACIDAALREPGGSNYTILSTVRIGMADEY